MATTRQKFELVAAREGNLFRVKASAFPDLVLELQNKRNTFFPKHCSFLLAVDNLQTHGVGELVDDMGED